MTTMIISLSVSLINILEGWMKGKKEEKKEGRV